MANQVPAWYHCGLDSAGLRKDRLTRPELQLGSVDFVVNGDYCSRSPQRPVFVFAIDVSAKALANGAARAGLRAVAATIHTLRLLAGSRNRRPSPSPFAASDNRMHSPAGGNGVAGGAAQFGSLEQPSPMRTTITNLEPLFAPPVAPGNFSSNQSKSLDLGSEDEVRVGIVTFARDINYYSVDQNHSGSQSLPLRVHVVPADDPFCPLPPSGWLLPLSSRPSAASTSAAENLVLHHQDKGQLDLLLDSMPQMMDALTAAAETEIERGDPDYRCGKTGY